MQLFSIASLIIALSYFSVSNASVPVHASSLFPIPWSGTDAIRSSSYTQALDILRKDSSITDTAFHFFKLGVLHLQLRDTIKALPYFKLAARQSQLLYPIVYLLLGDYALSNNDLKNALPSYVAALSPECPESYHKYIFPRIKKIFEQDSTIIPNDKQLDSYFQWFAQANQKKATPCELLLDTLLSTGTWNAIDTLLDTVSLPENETGKKLISIAGNEMLLQRLRPGTLLTCAKFALSGKNFGAARIFIDSAGKKADLTESNKARLLYLQAQLSYDTEDYNEAIRQFKRYMAKYGANSDVVMSIARSYRKKNNPSEASKWYRKHIELFPTHSKTPEILWLQAWQSEDRKKFAAAGALYQKIYTKYKSTPRREEAYLRHALCYYRQDKYDSSMSILSTFLKKFPTSTLTSSATFWKGKILRSQNKIWDASVCFRQVIDNDPLDYYAFRSRYYLTLAGDTTTVSIDSLTDFQAASRWIDSVMPSNVRRSFSHTDSLNYKRGILCASVGLIDIAEPFLNSIEKVFSQDFGLQYEIALLYSMCGASAQAYRIARKFTWRIPPEYRRSTPLAVYMLLYPSFYSSTITAEATTQDIDPNLVSAVIRQESIFDPQIVSPAGAIGLMQIMPYTGKQLATELNIPFTTDSLYNPFYNIRLGTYYIQSLMKKFNDNLIMVISSYNAGPHNAIKWFDKNKKKEIDLFVEDIEFTETRGYVKKVLGNFWTYKELSRYPAFFKNYTNQSVSDSNTNPE